MAVEPEPVIAAGGGQQPSRLARNALYNAVGQAALVVLNLVLVRVVFGGLGGDALGVLFASITLAALLSAALDLGASVTTALQISAYSASDVAYVRRLGATASLVYWTGFVLLVGLPW